MISISVNTVEKLVEIVQDDALKTDKRRPVLQKWVQELTLMQQSVLIAAVRGPDTIRKDHPVKVLCRWLRRCTLISAFEDKAVTDPSYPGGGSFTGPSMSCLDIEDGDIAKAHEQEVPEWHMVMVRKVKDGFLRCTDELPHHFSLHFIHAAEIIGYKHPDAAIKRFWRDCYWMCVNDMHLFVESEADMDKRLGDNEKNWRAREEVTAK